MNKLLKLSAIVFSMSLLAGCQTVQNAKNSVQEMQDNMYYGAWEKVGIHKREIMVDRVEEASESQEEAKEQFSSALEELQVLLNHDGGDLQRAYETASDEYEAAQKAAENVGKRVDAVENVALALFREWEAELSQYTNASLRAASEKQLRATQRNYQNLIRTMRTAEKKMQPILLSMKDNMLYLKHNLNAQAIGAIKGEFKGLETQINGLIQEMNRSIAESNKFISTLDNAN